MIRLFTALCKSLLDKIAEEQSFLQALEEFGLYDVECPHCGAIGMISGYGGYDRNHVLYIDGKVVDARVSPRRVKCSSCSKTHALLPDTLTPYSPYTLKFKLLVLIAYFKRDTTVVNICASFAIAVSTLYEWKKLMAAHKDFLLGILLSQKTPALAFLRGLLGSVDISGILHSFFHRHGFSFMQGASASAARSVPP